MDPDETLAKIRYLSHMYWKSREVQVDDILLAFSDLDEWLSRGGFLPAEWMNS